MKKLSPVIAVAYVFGTFSLLMTVTDDVEI